jgi:lysozyme
MVQLKGIDISHHNGPIDWAKVKADGVKFVFIKATQGINYSKVDYFRNHAPKALGFGLDVGAYHYATFSNVPEAVAEARYFLSVIREYKLTYPPVLDLEENKKNASRKELTLAAVAFMELLEKAGYKPILYTGKHFLETELDESKLRYPLWIARYGPQLGRDADIWQHSSSGKVNGISGNVDMNISYRDFAPKTVKKHIGTVKVTVNVLNVRKGPDIKEPIVKTVKKGEEYKTYDLVRGWYNVGAGWVSGNYVTFKK